MSRGKQIELKDGLVIITDCRKCNFRDDDYSGGLSHCNIESRIIINREAVDMFPVWCPLMEAE